MQVQSYLNALPAMALPCSWNPSVRPLTTRIPMNVDSLVVPRTWELIILLHRCIPSYEAYAVLSRCVPRLVKQSPAHGVINGPCKTYLHL